MMSIFRSKSNIDKERITRLKAEIAELKRVRDAQKLKIADQKRQLQEYWNLKIPTSFDYNADCLCVWGKDVGFMRDPHFMEAYQRGIHSGQKISGERNADLHIEWRVHVALWAAHHALRLEGDFVECGVNTGVLSLAICHHLNFNSTGRKLYLFDTYCGIPSEQIDHDNAPYEECYEMVKSNFSPYGGATLVRGMVPESLSFVEIEQVSYLSIDMNNTVAEIAAITHFWPKLSPGAMVLLDDYGWKFAHAQKDAMDKFAKSVGTEILTLPTGQGLFVKS